MKVVTREENPQIHDLIAKVLSELDDEYIICKVKLPRLDIMIGYLKTDSLIGTIFIESIREDYLTFNSRNEVKQFLSTLFKELKL